MIDKVNSVSRVSTKANGDLILMVAAIATTVPDQRLRLTQMIKRKRRQKESFGDRYYLFPEYISRDSTIVAR